MAKRRGGGTSSGQPDWQTPASRVRWLVDKVCSGNRSAFAERAGVSHTIIGKVVGGQQPGRKLLTAIADRFNVDAGWLLAGHGQPFPGVVDFGGTVGLPVAGQPLPGAPADFQKSISHFDTEAPSSLIAAGRYWLRLTSAQALAHKKGFLVGDRLLIGTDRGEFPRESHLYGQLCVVRGADPNDVRLASVTYFPPDPDSGPERLEADFFDEVMPADAKDEIYRHLPGGDIRHQTRRLKLTIFRGKERWVPVGALGGQADTAIRYTAIVGVWLQILHRR